MNLNSGEWLIAIKLLSLQVRPRCFHPEASGGDGGAEGTDVINLVLLYSTK